MGTQVGVGISYHRNPATAGKEAASQALQQAGIDRPDFVMLFATVGYRQAPLLQSVRAATQQAPLIGCSGAGIITQNVADESNFAVTVMVLRSDEMRFAHGMATGIKASSGRVGQAVGQAIAQSEASASSGEAQALFLFLEGISPNFDEFMEGLRSQTKLEQSIPAIGGFAGDNIAIRETFQYCDDRVVNDGAVWALLSGEVRVASVFSHGCVPFGGKHTVTKSDRNTVYEVDNTPVLEVLKGYLTEAEMDDWGIAPVMLAWAFDVPHHLQMNGTHSSSESSEKFIRCMVSKDDRAGAINFISDVPTGRDFWIARRDHEQIYTKTDQMADRLLHQLGDLTPKLIFHVECVGRGKLFFRETEKLRLTNRLQASIGKEIPWVGLYVFAEIGPVARQNCIHNFTSILTAIY